MTWQAAGEKAEALDEYETYRKQMEELVKEDSNANWQRDLSLSYNDVGDILNAQGKREEALASYNQGLAVARRSRAWILVTFYVNAIFLRPISEWVMSRRHWEERTTR